MPIVFDGNPKQWLDWMGFFSATIDTTDLSYSEKLTHLQRIVSGDAPSLIRGSGCYAFIYNACLENDFGNPTKIVTAFFRRLDNIRSPTLRHSRSYKDFASFVQTTFDAFTTLGFHHDLHSTTNI